MVETRLEDKRLLVYFKNHANKDCIVNAIENHLNNAGNATINNSNYTEIKSDAESVTHPHKLTIDFDLINEDNLVIGSDIAENVQNDSSLETADIEVHYTGSE